MEQFPKKGVRAMQSTHAQSHVRLKSQLDQAIHLVVRCGAAAPVPAQALRELLEEVQFSVSDQTIDEATWRVLRDLALAGQAFNDALGRVRSAVPALQT
jgi:hypothetical protein